MASTGKGSKTKGSSYERKVAKKLSTWWGDEFQRTPASGGLRWKSDNNVIGDIVPSPTANFPFVVECKHQEGGWTLESVILNKLNVKEWWSQVVADGRRGKKTPLLMFTRNYAEDFVMMPYSEEVYQKLLDREHPLMRTCVAYTEEITGQEERFDVIVTSYTGFTSFEPEYWKKNYMADWDTVTRLSKDIEPPVENLDDLVDKLKK